MGSSTDSPVSSTRRVATGRRLHLTSVQPTAPRDEMTNGPSTRPRALHQFLHHNARQGQRRSNRFIAVAFAVGADAYDRFMGRYSVPLAPLFADLAEVVAGQHVLDVGCGPGALTSELVRRLGPAAVSAVDPSESFVAAVQERYPGVDVSRCSAEQLPFGDQAFDA